MDPLQRKATRCIDLFFILCLSLTPALFILWVTELSREGHDLIAVLAAGLGGGLTIRAGFAIYALLKALADLGAD